MQLPLQKNIGSIEEMEALAEELSEILVTGNIIVLNGELGTGKTTLTKLICKNFGIENVNSPSFSIVNEYTGKYKVYHFDFYRIKKLEELYDIGLEDYVNDEDSIMFIEWGNLFPDLIPKNHFEISIRFSENENRIISIIDKNQ